MAITVDPRDEDSLEILAAHLVARCMRTARIAADIEAEIDRQGSNAQWASASRNLAGRMPDISHTPGLMARKDLLMSDVPSLYAFKAQYSDIPTATRKGYVHAMECTTTAPWQALPTVFVC